MLPGWCLGAGSSAGISDIKENCYHLSLLDTIPQHHSCFDGLVIIKQAGLKYNSSTVVLVCGEGGRGGTGLGGG